MEGSSFLKVLDDNSNQLDQHRDKIYMFEHEAISRRGLRTLKWKFIKNAREDSSIESKLQALGYISIAIEPTAAKELYDLENDPMELNNVIEKYPTVAEELENDLETFVQTTCERIGIPDPQQEQELEPWGDYDNINKWQMLLIERNNKFKKYDP